MLYLSKESEYNISGKEVLAMTENMMKHLILEDKISRIVGPIVCIYLLWLAFAAMFNFEALMISLAVQFVVLLGYMVIEPLISRKKNQIN